LNDQGKEGRLETTAAALAFSAALAEVINLGNSLRQNPELADAYDDEAIEVVQNGNEIHVDIANGERQFIVTVTEPETP
jgi:predicted NBD/HSP70 family sugar kinase